MSFSLVLQEQQAKRQAVEDHYQAVKEKRQQELQALAEQADLAFDKRRNRKARIDAGELPQPKPLAKPQKEVAEDIIKMLKVSPNLKIADIAERLNITNYMFDKLANRLRDDGRLTYDYHARRWIVVEIE